MSEHKSSDIGHLWLLAGFGMAAVGAKLMWDNFARLHRAGEPARLLDGAAPLAMTGWMFGQFGHASQANPAGPQVSRRDEKRAEKPPVESTRSHLLVVEPVEEAELAPAVRIPAVVPAPRTSWT